jgi:hypothetical protein
MLVSQATALQTIFTSLARRAAVQEQLRHYEAFLGLALKAQAQKPSDHLRAGRFEVSPAGHIRKASQHRPRAATG